MVNPHIRTQDTVSYVVRMVGTRLIRILRMLCAGCCRLFFRISRMIPCLNLRSSYVRTRKVKLCVTTMRTMNRKKGEDLRFV